MQILNYFCVILYILILISCFNESEASQLKNQLKVVIDNDIINNIVNDEYKPPLFEYLKYLKNYGCHNANDLIYNWFKYHLNLSYKSRIRKIHENFTATFHQSILYHCINIKQLN